jgi:predicted RND superfamily exporter protein
MAGLHTLPLRRPRLFLVVIGLITAGFAVVIARDLRFDNTLAVWFPPDDPDLARYRAFRAVFGDDSAVAVAYDGADLQQDRIRRWLGTLQRDLGQLPGVDLVRGPFLLTEEDIGELGDPGMIQRRFVSADERTLVMLVYPDRHLAGPARVDLFGAIEQRARSSDLSLEPILVGPESINQWLDRGSQESFGTLFPVVVVIVGGVLLVALRRIRLVLGILLVAGVSIVWTLGALTLAGRPMNLVVSVLPALLVVLGTAYSLHVAERFLEAPAATLPERWAFALRDTWRPCLITALTTSAGLGSLALASLTPVRDLGVVAAAGVLLSYGLVCSLLPAFVIAVQPGWVPRPAAPHATTRLPRLVGLLRVARYPILLGTLALVAVAALGLRQLQAGSDILSFFPVDHPVRRGTELVEDRLFGLTPLELWWRGPTRDLGSATGVAALRALERTVTASEPDVTGVFSVLQADPGFRDATDEQVAGALRELAGFEQLPEQVHGYLVQGEPLQLRQTLAVRTIPIEATVALSRRVEQRLTEVVPPGVEAEVTGAIPILVHMQALLLQTQVRTFAASFGVVTLLLLLAFRSIRLALLSLVPNLLPILCTLGLMGHLGIPLDVATVTVASIAFGLVVDDTIHLLHRYRAATLDGRRGVERWVQVLRATGRPVIVTSLAAGLGFAAFLVAPFRPTHDFGLLVALAAALALLADLIVLPALLLGTRR